MTKAHNKMAQTYKATEIFKYKWPKQITDLTIYRFVKQNKEVYNKMIKT